MMVLSVMMSIFVFTVSVEGHVATTNLNVMVDNLAKQNWDADEVHCRNRISSMFENVKNSTLWATWVWNSMEQSPTGIFFGARYHLGNYDQCLRPPWLLTHPELRTQYCLAEIEMNKDGVNTMHQDTDPYGEAEKYYVDSRTIFGRNFSFVGHGVCLPAGCSSKSVQKFVKALMNTGYLRAAKDAVISINYCKEAGAPHDYTKEFYLYILTFAVLLFIAVISTYYINAYPGTANSHFIGNPVAISFCFQRNWESIVKNSKSELRVLHGIRFLIAILIPYMHLMGLIQGTSVSNAIDLEQMTKELKAYAFIHGDVLTDTFLAMSGLLLGRCLLTMDITKSFNLLNYILLRYLRLIGPLVVSVFFMACVLMHTDDGPLYHKLALFEQQACMKNGWLTLLMLGNYVNTSEMCLPTTWYIPVDFQLYFSTLVLLYLYRKNHSTGKWLTVVIIVVGFLSPAISTLVHNLPAMMFYNAGVDVHPGNNKYFNYGYIQTHNRMGPYVVGLAVGYFMSIYTPKDDSKLWCKTKSRLAIGACLSLMLTVLATGLHCFHNEVHGILACIFAIVERTAFAVAVLGVIVICTYGDVPIIKSFLSWHVFVPLSRLSYGLYIIHPLIMYRSKLSMRIHMKHHMFDTFTESLGVTMVSLALSLGVWLLVEAPLANFTHWYFNKPLSNERDDTTSKGIPGCSTKQKDE